MMWAFKRAFYLVFGVLAILIGSAIFLWIIVNAFTNAPEFTESLRSGGDRGHRLLGGLAFCFTMISVGMMWLYLAFRRRD